MATAALLRQQGIPVRIVERGNAPTPFSKAIGVHARTLESMHALGLTEKLVSQGHPMHAFRLVEDGKTILQAGFGKIGSAYPFVLGLPQSRTERTLLERLESLGGAVEWNTELVAILQLGRPDCEPAVVRLRRPDGSLEEVACNWLVGADGSRSAVRELAGIGFPGGDYGKAFVLGDVRIDWDGPKQDLQFFLSANGYMLLVPMPNGMHRIIAQTDKTFQDFQHPARPSVTLDDLQQIVDLMGPGRLRIHSPDWLTSAPFYHRRADTCVTGRTVLVGDAFHLFSPLGAQGLNTGFQDAFNLGWKLAYIEKGWASASLVDTYRDEREAIANLIANVTSRTTEYLTATAWHQRFKRRVLTRLRGKTAQAQDMLPRMLAGLMQAYDARGELAGTSAPGLPQAGQRIPHAWLPDGAGYKPLAALLHGTRFTLLVVKNRLDDISLELLENFYLDSLQRHPYLAIAVVTREVAALNRVAGGVNVIEDRLGGVFAALGVTGEASLLVRPDGYCAASAHGWSPDAIDAYFMEAGIRPSLNTTSNVIKESAYA
jgi:2-polyprenyl-6-methoxyphenol hydroxylase-like FAD-dependent oxidoreductase